MLLTKQFSLVRAPYSFALDYETVQNISVFICGKYYLLLHCIAFAIIQHSDDNRFPPKMLNLILLLLLIYIFIF